MNGSSSLITTNGLVIRERSSRENDKFIDILTRDLGIIEINVRGAKKITSKSSAGTQMFTYSTLCFSKKGNRYFLNSCTPVRSFYSLSQDIFIYSLACYFCELVKYTITSEQHSENVLRLLLNTLHFLALGKKDISLLKSIFELRLLTEIGFMPDLVACRHCHKYSGDDMYFDCTASNIICNDCLNKINKRHEHIIKINESELYALRYIVFTDFEKLYNFNLSDIALKRVSFVCEHYLLEKLDRSFKTLDFYKEIQG